MMLRFCFHLKESLLIACALLSVVGTAQAQTDCSAGSFAHMSNEYCFGAAKTEYACWCGSIIQYMVGVVSDPAECASKRGPNGESCSASPIPNAWDDPNGWQAFCDSLLGPTTVFTGGSNLYWGGTPAECPKSDCELRPGYSTIVRDTWNCCFSYQEFACVPKRRYIYNDALYQDLQNLKNRYMAIGSTGR